MHVCLTGVLIPYSRRGAEAFHVIRRCSWTTGGLIEDEWETLHFPFQDQIWYESSLTVHFLIANSQVGLFAELFVLAQINKQIVISFCITFK